MHIYFSNQASSYCIYHWNLLAFWRSTTSLLVCTHTHTCNASCTWLHNMMSPKSLYADKVTILTVKVQNITLYTCIKQESSDPTCMTGHHACGHANDLPSATSVWVRQDGLRVRLRHRWSRHAHGACMSMFICACVYMFVCICVHWHSLERCYTPSLFTCVQRHVERMIWCAFHSCIALH